MGTPPRKESFFSRIAKRSKKNDVEVKKDEEIKKDVRVELDTNAKEYTKEDN